MNAGIWLIIVLLGLLLGFLSGYFYRQLSAIRAQKEEQKLAEDIIARAKEEARVIQLQAKDKALEIRQAADAEIARRRAELIKEEDRLQRRREEIDIRLDRLEKREQALTECDR